MKSKQIPQIGVPREKPFLSAEADFKIICDQSVSVVDVRRHLLATSISITDEDYGLENTEVATNDKEKHTHPGTDFHIKTYGESG